jgi:zinc transport system substrate-binding protein
MRPAARLLLLAALGLPAAGCGGLPPGPGGAGTHLIVVSVAPQAWFVERLLAGAEPARIEVMIPPGASSEVEAYSPTPSQMRSLEQADLYVLVGHPLISVEAAYVKPLLASHPAIGAIDMGRGIAQGTDPHLWVSPATVRACAKNLGEGLAARWPEAAPVIARNLAGVLAEVDALDRELRDRFATAARRTFLVDHPALGYIAGDYSLRQLAIEDEGKEPGLARLTGIVEEAKKEGITTVFSQSGFSPKQAELIARALGGTVVPIDVLARDWPENTRRIGRELGKALGAGA